MGVRELVYGAYERRLARQLHARGTSTSRPSGARIPRHVGVILDGNRRWAQGEGLSPATGHRRGGDKVADLVGWCEQAGVEVVTLYLLSTDNLDREDSEVAAILEVIERVVFDLAGPRERWKVNPMGALDLLPAHTARVLKDAAAATRTKTGLTVNVAVGYGGRHEITDAVRSLLTAAAARDESVDQVAAALDVDQIAEHLYTKGQPDPDLVIRTSGEQRLSGFLLWQTAHSEFYFCDALWPDFRHVDFLRALRSFAARQRRYGS
jgi:short-chain Z-isoprenyl diphosphate synthase